MKITLGSHGRAFSGCMAPLNFVQFADTPPGMELWAARLVTDFWINSVVACLSSYANGTEIAEGWERLNAFSEELAPGIPVPEYATVLERVERLGKIPVVDVMAGVVRNSTVLITRGAYDSGLKTQDVFAEQMDYHRAFGGLMYLLLIVMTFIGLGNRILAAVVTNKSKNRCFIRARTWVCRHISTPALMGYRHVQPWSFLSIPTRLEGILIAVYCLINLVSAFVCYEVFEDNMFFYHREDLQYARYFADRTGIMSFFNMVLLWVLAGRNDMVIWLTGWSYQSMNLFHRWTARVATIQAIAHSIAYSYIKYGYLWEMTFSQTWSVWATGVYSTIVMSLILPLSIRTLRTRQYEVFLAIHIVMSILLLVFLYLHVLPLGFEATVIICFGIWVLDRLFRILRVVYLSFNTLKTQNAIAEVTANDPSLLRLRVTASVRLNPSPGDYYFLYSKWWPENHPFTLASWNPTPDGSATELHFLIAPMAGWTRRLRNRSEEGSKTTILLEGPYGHPRDLAAYDNVLLLAGGSGIASILPYVSTLRDKARVTLVWTVRNADYAADVLDNELAEANTGHVDIHVYFTQQNLDEARAVLDKSHGGRLTLCPGRPNVRSALDESIASLGKGRLAVLACGPAMMMDDTRRQVAKSYGTWLGTVEAGRLEYFEESFTW